jgi:hypothetical protein
MGRISSGAVMGDEDMQCPMEEISELAGNLKAELYMIQDEHKTGRISSEVAMVRIGEIRRRREAARQEMSGKRRIVRLTDAEVGTLFGRF